MVAAPADTVVFRDRLRSELSELRRSIQRNMGDIHIEHVSDELDNVVSKSQREMALAGYDRAAVTLRRVLAALQRIEYGGYGECIVCETAIPHKRLIALPWAERCVTCQEQHDNSEKEQTTWGLEALEG